MNTPLRSLSPLLGLGPITTEAAAPLVLRILATALLAVPIALKSEEPAETLPRGGPPPGLFGAALVMEFDRVEESGFRGISGERQSAHAFGVRTDYRFPVSRGAALRTGIAYRRFTYSSTGLPLPRNLQEVNLPITLTLLGERGPRYIVTLTPGIGFEQTVTAKALRLSYLGYRNFNLGETLSLQLGAFGGTSSKYPVLPGLGLIWNFSDSGTLRLVPPRPALEFTPNENWTFSLGGSFHGGSFRVTEKEGIPQNALLNLTEYRAGARFSRTVAKTMELTAGAGWMIKRKFDHHRESVVHRTRGAPYAELGLRVSF